MNCQNNSPPKVYVILLNWCNADDTISCLKSLSLLTGDLPKIIVCDNASADDSWKTLQAYISSQDTLDIELIQTGANLGFAGGNNVGLRYALSDPTMGFVWVLNNDTVIDHSALIELTSYMSQNPQIGVCGTTLLYMDEPDLIQAVGGKFNAWLGTSQHLCGHQLYSLDLCSSVDVASMDYVVGASMFIRRSVLEQVGLLSEDYFLYYEEIDFAERIKREAPNFGLGYASKSLVFHKEGGSTGANDLAVKTYNYTTDFYFITSRIKFTKKFYPLRMPIVRFTMLGVAVNRFKRKQWRSAILALAVFVGFIPQTLVPST